jgi:hypothetical protein
MAITWTDVEALAPALSTVSAEAQALILAQVARQVGPNKWGALVDDGQLYLAAHLGSAVLSAASSGDGGSVVGPVVSESVGPVSRTFAVLAAASSSSSAFASTWGQEYVRLRKLLPTRFGLVI